MSTVEREKEQVVGLIEAPLRTEGYELADVVLSKYKNKSTLRLFVYGKNGTSIDECARLSRMVGEIIDGTDLFASGYTLEVSSPGLDRPLTTEQDFRYRVGETVRIEFADGKRKKIEAKIVAATADVVTFEVDGEPVDVPLEEIKSAKIIF